MPTPKRQGRALLLCFLIYWPSAGHFRACCVLFGPRPVCHCSSQGQIRRRGGHKTPTLYFHLRWIALRGQSAHYKWMRLGTLFNTPFEVFITLGHKFANLTSRPRSLGQISDSFHLFHIHAPRHAYYTKRMSPWKCLSLLLSHTGRTCCQHVLLNIFIFECDRPQRQ